MEPIPEDRLITFEQLGRTFCFDYDTLIRNYLVSNEMTNPLNRMELPDEIQWELLSIMNDRSVHVNVEFRNRYGSFDIRRYDTIGELLYRIYDEIPGAMGYIGQLRQFVTVNPGLDTRAFINIYNYPLTSPIVDIIGEGSVINTRIVIPIIGPINRDTPDMMEKLYEYADRYNIQEILDAINPEYGIRDLMDILYMALRGTYPDEN